MGSARSVFSLAAPDERQECYVIDSANPAHSATREASLTRQRHVQKIWAEQEAKNAELHEIDHSHIPPLRIAERYAGGIRPKAANGTRSKGKARND